MLRWVRDGGSLAAAPWKILLQKGDKFLQVGDKGAQGRCLFPQCLESGPAKAQSSASNALSARCLTRLVAGSTRPPSHTTTGCPQPRAVLTPLPSPPCSPHPPQVGQTKARPSQQELELAFLNASAASSPLTSAAKGFRSLVDGIKKNK